MADIWKWGKCNKISKLFDSFCLSEKGLKIITIYVKENKEKYQQNDEIMDNFNKNWHL